MAVNTEANSLIDSIFGSANPGDDGKQDDSIGLDTGDDAGDTEPVEDNDLDTEQDNDDQDDGDNEHDAENNSEGDEEPELEAQPRPRGRPAKQETEDKSDLFDPSAEVKTDAQGNVFIGKTLVAKAGREARMYMSFRKAAIKDRKAAEGMAQNISRMAQGARELVTRYNALEQTKTMFESAGLSAEEQTQLLPIALAYKKNPIEGIKLLLTRAHMAGVDIKSIAGGAAIDPKVLMEDMKSHITALMKPVHDQTTKSANQDRLADEAKGFFQRNSRAAEVAKIVGGSHKLGAILKEAKQRSPDLTLDELFQRLDYALLSQGVTAPVADGKSRKPSKPQRSRMERNFRSQVRKPSNSVESFDDIAADVLKQFAPAATRGF